MLHHMNVFQICIDMLTFTWPPSFVGKLLQLFSLISRFSVGISSRWKEILKPSWVKDLLMYFSTTEMGSFTFCEDVDYRVHF